MVVRLPNHHTIRLATGLFGELLTRWGYALAWAVVALDPGGLLGSLFSALCEELEEVGWERDGFACGKDGLELLLQVLRGWVS